MFGLGFLGGLFGGAREGAGLYGNLVRNFGGAGPDTAFLDQSLSIIGSLRALSGFFARSLGWTSDRPISVLSGAANTRHDVGNVLRMPGGGAGDSGFNQLRAIAEGGPAVSLRPTMRQIGDGPVINGSPELSSALRSYFAGESAQFKRSAPGVPTYA